MFGFEMDKNTKTLWVTVPYEVNPVEAPKRTYKLIVHDDRNLDTLIEDFKTAFNTVKERCEVDTIDRHNCMRMVVDASKILRCEFKRYWQ